MGNFIVQGPIIEHGISLPDFYGQDLQDAQDENVNQYPVNPPRHVIVQHARMQ